MWNDPIVEGTRRLRDEYAALFNYDLRAIFLDLEKKEGQHAEKVVSLESPDLLKMTDQESSVRHQESDSLLTADR